MKTISLLFCSVLLFAGCVSNPPPSPTPAVQNFVPLIESFVSVAPPLILAKNPTYAPLIEAVATGIPAAFGSGELTPKTIAQSVAVLGKRIGVDAETQSIIATSISGAVAWYQATYGIKTLSATDPNFAAILNAVAVGLNNGVSTWRATQPVACVPPSVAWPAS